MTHTLKVKSDQYSHCSVLELDGKTLEDVQSLSIELRSEHFAQVTIKMIAAVDFEGNTIEVVKK
jgi:hypothetical protein